MPLSFSPTDYATTGAAVAATAFFAYVYHDYRTYCNLDPTSIHSALRGYLLQVKAQLLTRNDHREANSFDPETYAPLDGPRAAESFLKLNLSPCEGTRPRCPATAGRTPTNDKLLEHSLSRFDGYTQAIQLNADVIVPQHLQKTRSTIGHVHVPDGSMHVILTLDARGLCKDPGKFLG
ncbi:hypothetical protein NLG97_g1317 [Lecanicillium saksenae]|uniref:Uncharacterized protein n=1 Tax=Lecanicillium saksenae TaxID=468837 RepID=A0ACC1R7I2_9HYPO|nr:hypothetical protein NLG97_g1317 [Lecanicillium saksenae]